jgi:integrase
MISRIDRRPRKNGKVSWRVRVFRGYDEDGRRVQDSATFETKREAEEYAASVNAERRAGPRVSVLTVNGYLDQWLETVKATKEFYTWRRYKMLVRPVRDALGDVRLDKLAAVDLEGVYSGLYERVSARSVRNLHGAIRAALNRAVRQKLIAHNPALGCELRACDTAEAAVLEQAQMRQIEDAAGDGWLGVVVRLAMDTGARRGELCALRWQDLQGNQLRISRSVGQEDDGTVFIKPTKTRSQRTVSLPPATVDFLEQHRDQQRKAARLLGADYRGDLDLIIAGPDGEYMKPQTLSMSFARLAARLGLKRIGLHSLRHSHATALLSSGAPLAAVSKRLGHRDTYTTAKIYSHALPSDEAALGAMWEAIRDGKMGENGGPARKQGKKR